MFADQLVTDDLLDNLKIKQTCILRCDYFHLFHSVFLIILEGTYGFIVFDHY